MFTRRPGWSWLLDRALSDPQGVRLVSELRRRYGSDYLWLDVFRKPSLLVLDLRGIRQILDSSPEVYGPPDLKVRGMSHFQPEAVTVSIGDDWRRRRAFTDEVLASGVPIHPRASEFLGVVASATGPLTAPVAPAVRWRDLHEAFRKITTGVVFGPFVEADSVLARLDHLMRRANRIAGRTDTPERNALHNGIRARVTDPRAGGLAAVACPHLAPDDPLPVAGQVPHWLFAMRDTLATHCANTLALVAAHAEAQERICAEVAGTDLSDPAGVNRMVYLEGSLREAMRLWSTTPLIVRKALRDDELGGHPVPAGSQVIIHNGFNHRSSDAIADPDRFQPEIWPQGVWDYRFNSMSNGPQACAGRELALFLGKAVLGRLFERHGWRLRRPTLDSRAPIPQAFDHRALVVNGRAAG
jgi:hypothetical protein